MRYHSSTAIVGLAALMASLLSACGGGGDATAPAGTPEASPAVSPSLTAGGTGQETFKNPTVAGGKQPAPQAVGNLITSTNPEERVARVRAGRTDPFGTIPVTRNGINPGGQNRATPVTRIVGPPAQPPRLAPPAILPSPPLRPATPPPTAASPGPVLPPLPEPDLARAIEVTGVVQVGNVPQAIIKAPNESTPRYVRAGQRIANGQVLVKRIEIRPFGEPVVILQEQGVEVPKAVSAPAEDANFVEPVLVSNADQ